MEKVIILFLGYLLGSIPSALIVGKLWKGIDVRNYGSGNLGATNVLRTLGWGPAIITGVMDVGKGVLTIFLTQRIVPKDYLFTLLSAGFAIIGHSYPLFANFKGGRSVGVSFGILLYLFPKATSLILPLGILIAFLTKYKSVASITCSIIFPFILYYLERPPKEYLIGSILVGLFIIFRHIPNIKRLIKGKENKIEWFNKSKN
ncbi:MAG: glycerol-3-phosphate 1-O-acyltransferase PlsY [Dictyoglomus sp.]|nr:glycerol-3-phosphate 1-O-acyltransferase PlsY [Dictyoglomus sp.]MCX7941891.1 glycerol-3-phosphate 1-O-acyltransferase PlsY [Dictyoglomaceae bacterium]MDW8188582.1 glycerol-3-phosphate 1-O-acyltransferase PlsY [Dictyoglomus sp.]